MTFFLEITSFRNTKKRPIYFSCTVPPFCKAITVPGVDNPMFDKFRSHREFTLYANELLILTGLMRQYAKVTEKLPQNILDATLKYGLEAHDVYVHALHKWLEENPSHLSRPPVQRLVKEHNAKDCDHLRRYYRRALKEPDLRSTTLALIQLTACNQVFPKNH